MKIFVTGVAGQLGHDLMNELAKRGHEGVGTDLAPEYAGIQDGTPVTKMPYVSLDITNRDAVEKTIAEIRPDAVIHCAAWTAVDAAEDDDKREKVKAINVGGTQNIADACKNVDAKMLYLSTDYVFDGQGTTPWDPDCKDYKPLNNYGQTKLGGELAVSGTLEKYFIVRIAWVFGLNGKNFIKTMLNVGKTHPEVRVVCDQIGTPTYTYDLARLLVDMVETEKYGYYHATNSELPMPGPDGRDTDHDADGTKCGYISWYDFTCEIFHQAGLDTKITPVTTAEYGLSKAARPFNSRLDKSKLEKEGFKPLPDWKDALARYLEALKMLN
ncbi:MAG: dTDP-4-dehydrorhamnose reductase [Eubacterium sp.]|nr:dTDP-4-dehydrorhamnose reductase [Eubacterium sp.]